MDLAHKVWRSRSGIWLAIGLLWLCVVMLLSLIKLPESGTGVNDKLSHLITYGFLSTWFSLLASTNRQLMSVLVLLFFYGCTIEILQSLTDYRSAEWFDVVANAVGIMLGWLGYQLALHRRLRQVLSVPPV